MSDELLMIECGTHGKSVAAAVCGHLVNNRQQPLGFVENSTEPNHLQGLCYACEYVFLQEEDKTEAFEEFCNHPVVCKEWYEEIKVFHSIDC